MSEAFSIPESTVTLLQVPHPAHDDALELYENGEFARANEAFAEAAAISTSRTVRLNEIVEGAEDALINIAREVAYGRVLLHWALSTEAQFRHYNDDSLRHTALTLAIGRARRGLVLLEQDQHKIVPVDEVDAARDTVNMLQGKLANIAPPASAPELSKPRTGLDESDAEIIELAEAAKALAA